MTAGSSKMDWRDVSSSMITRVGYDAASMTLTVEFRNGAIYEYFEIPENIFDELVSSASAGQFLAQNIKGIYRYARS